MPACIILFPLSFGNRGGKHTRIKPNKPRFAAFLLYDEILFSALRMARLIAAYPIPWMEWNVSPDIFLCIQLGGLTTHNTPIDALRLAGDQGAIKKESLIHVGKR